jgi:pimeloyl-ACP methyl ester carboxylesterase
MVPLMRRFRRDGRVVFTYHHGMFQMRSLRSSAQELTDHLRGLSESLETPRFDVVGFSLGGLAVLHAVKFLQAQRFVRRLALLAVPVQGTWAGMAGIAAFGLLSASVWQCLPGSPFLRALREAPVPPGVRILQVYAAQDALCPTGPPIEGVDPEHDYVVLPGSHSSLCVSQRFYARLREFFDAPEQELESARAAFEDGGT